MRDCDRPPELGDLLYESLGDGDDWLQRAFEIVGVEETRSERTFGLVLLRIEWADFVDRLACFTTADEWTRVWAFVRDRR